MQASTTPVHPSQQFEKVCQILERNHRQPSRLIPILQAVQEEYRYLPEEVLAYVATSLGIPPSRVYGVATFYAHFALQPKGKHVVRLCDGTACHVKASIPILEALRARLGLSEQRKTTPDMLFTVETVACLGACGLAPVLVVDDEVHGSMTPQSAVALVDALVQKEASR
ncbi:MAG TPA: NAD(P)H-dependent oxidoreductase subunit E [Myxococcales bacterium]|jgi:NADH-quinone oxidoreductase subunit E